MAETLAPAVPIAFYAAVIVLAVAELLRPWRVPTTSLGRRWLTNIGLFAIAQLILGFVVPVSAVVLAKTAADSGIGLLNLVPLPDAAAVGLGFLMLDLWKYGEHRLVHTVPVLWRLHRVHHSDVDVDFTTGQRHHPLETLLGAGGLLLVVYAGGVPPLAVVLYMIVAGVNAVLTHANLRFPEAVDRGARRLFVTPAVHGVHHSARRVETDSNYGLVLSVWDRLLGTYRTPDPAEDRRRVLGLEYFRDARDARLDRVVLQPLLATAASGPAPAAAPGQPLTP